MSWPRTPKMSPMLAGMPLVSILDHTKTHRTTFDRPFDTVLGAAQAGISGFDVDEEQRFHVVLPGEAREDHVIDRLEQRPAISWLVRKARKRGHDFLDDLAEVDGLRGSPRDFRHQFSAAG